MTNQGSAWEAMYGSTDDRKAVSTGTGKRRASPPSSEHPDAPPTRRPMTSNVPFATDEGNTTNFNAPLPNTAAPRVPCDYPNPQQAGPNANPFASSATDLRLPENASAAASSGILNQQAFGAANDRDDNAQTHTEDINDDAVTTTTDREFDHRQEAAYQLRRRLNLQRAQAHLGAIGAVLEVSFRNGQDQKIADIRVKLETLVDRLNR